MCGRITLKLSPRELQELFDVIHGLDSIQDWSPRYNVAPTTTMICVRDTDEGREIFPARWGLIPFWAKEALASTFNARSDGVATKPMFRSAFNSRRCLVVASGFYEWRKITPKEKQPYYVTLTSGDPMPMAGLWETWKNPAGDVLQSCTIVTHTANDMMAPLHDRMPVILTHNLINAWLDRRLTTAAEVQPLLGHYPASEMQAWPVTKDVGNVRNQGEYLIKPLEG